jgi:hypothetical protein
MSKQPNSSNITLGVLHTRPLQDHDSPDKEIGLFEQPVTLSTRMFLESGDKSGLVRTTIATYLASAVLDTKVPQDYWFFTASEFLQQNFTYPERMSFGAL